MPVDAMWCNIYNMECATYTFLFMEHTCDNMKGPLVVLFYSLLELSHKIGCGRRELVKLVTLVCDRMFQVLEFE